MPQPCFASFSAIPALQAIVAAKKAAEGPVSA